jgi:hypothetical protein
LTIGSMASFSFITRMSSLPRKENSVYDMIPAHSQRSHRFGYLAVKPW